MKWYIKSNYGKDGYMYITKHGIGPGTLPKDVKLLDAQDLDNYMTAIWLDRFLTTKELEYYDIYPETSWQHKEYSKGIMPIDSAIVLENDHIDDTSDDYLKMIRKNAKKMAKRDGYNYLIIKDKDGRYSFTRKHPRALVDWSGDEVVEVVKASRYDYGTDRYPRWVFNSPRNDVVQDNKRKYKSMKTQWYKAAEELYPDYWQMSLRERIAVKPEIDEYAGFNIDW